MDSYTQANRALWNAWTLLHEKSEEYDVPGFRAGRCALKPIELAEVGDVAGKTLLHLQCHFGLDTLSWARRGARVTGVDFSDEAIRLARSLSSELAIPAEFIRSDIYELDRVLDREFDIVFTSYGVLVWLSDIRLWGRTVARFLKPGGIFYIAELHPITMIFDNMEPVTEYRAGLPVLSPTRADPFHGPGLLCRSRRALSLGDVRVDAFDGRHRERADRCGTHDRVSA